MKFISDFEKTATELAVEQGYKYVICGHIHQPKMIRKIVKNETCLYLNSGDWVENLTALEYDKRKWRIYDHQKEKKLIQPNTAISAMTIFSKIRP